MAAGGTAVARLLTSIGLGSGKRSILMLVVAWALDLFWLGLNYFWRFASVEVLLAIPILLLLYALIAVAGYLYWGVREVREQDAPYAGVMVGMIVAITLLYFNFNLLQFVLDAIQ
ncbi:hypothetical protein [Pontibacter akesuensis]|uniref:Uncharacterized protein n=1 Tax=Pontibacter akesuensis TaxID=388950 RepID=A0A1I7JH64_9BACT|nr:hypothetical protein [Pontibacter akesuensis]GHA70009.1 hypothetical protein GCM10007389_24010 [Pontibacter akesuensis]SFU84515.1 hypothetical protein SAMN04487941_2867 [Pontibacter akesuensis]